MAEEAKLNEPWLVAVWPGMGHVAISAGYYLMAKLGMHLLVEYAAQELFDVEFVEIKSGLIFAAGRFPQPVLYLERSGSQARHHSLHRRSPATHREVRILSEDY